MPVRRRERVVAVGVVGVQGELHYRLWERCTGEEVVRLLEELRWQYGEYRMVLDQAPWHRSWRVKQYLQAHPEIELIWLPAYTPELNPVEFVWKLLKGRVVKGRYFASLAELKQAIRKFFVYLYNMPSRWRHLLRRFIPCYP